MKKILIVDDEQNIRDNFKEYFMFDPEYEIFSAATGREAIDQITKNKPDLIILDWWLKSDVEGKDVLTFIKKTCPDVPVFAVTAARDSIDEIKAMGVKDCFLKPCPDIFGKIRELFSSSEF